MKIPTLHFILIKMSQDDPVNEETGYRMVDQSLISCKDRISLFSLLHHIKPVLWFIQPSLQ
jgi:hypothetical protein